MNITENEFDELFLKNLFKEFIKDTQVTFAQGELDKMATIITKIFLREFGSGKIPSQMIQEHEDIEEWLDEQIENFVFDKHF